MSELDLDSSVVDWAIEQPRAAVLFETLGIDYSCGGKSLRYECQRQQLNPADVLERLQRLLKEQSEPPH